MGWEKPAKMNVNGGANAPIAHKMLRRDARKGRVALSIGGGRGVALTVECD